MNRRLGCLVAFAGRRCFRLWRARWSRWGTPAGWRIGRAVLAASGYVNRAGARAVYEVERMGDAGWGEEDQHRSSFCTKIGRIGYAGALELRGQVSALALQDPSVRAITRPVHGRQRARELILFEHADNRIRRHPPRPTRLAPAQSVTRSRY